MPTRSPCRLLTLLVGLAGLLAADPHGQASAKLGVAGLPTTLFIAADGTLRGRRVGAMTAEQLRAAVATYLGQRP